MYVVGVDSCLEKGICHVHNTPNLSFHAIRGDVVYAGERMRVSDCIRVKGMVIVNPVGQDGSIGLWDEERWGGMLRVGGTELPRIKMFLNQHTPGFFIFAWGTVGSSCNSF